MASLGQISLEMPDGGQNLGIEIGLKSFFDLFGDSITSSMASLSQAKHIGTGKRGHAFQGKFRGQVDTPG